MANSAVSSWIKTVYRAGHTDFGKGGDWSPPIGGGPKGGGQGFDGGGLARDSRQDKRDQKNWFKPLIISYFLVYQHNNVINWSSNQLDMFLLLKIKS